MSLRGIYCLAKSVVRLKGCDTSALLNGLLTNEVNSANPLIYSFLLNSQGRVMFDLFMYKLNNDDVLLEVDKSAEQQLIKLLNFYKLRRSVNILSTSLIACVAPSAHNCAIVQGVDPRLPELGHKLVFEKTVEFDSCMENEYHELRYRLGVSEGLAEFGVGKAIPLEYNGDYLNAISFEKGCYIGQELTARAYHTGVVRKRIMPLKSDRAFGEIEAGIDPTVLNEKSTKVGVLKAASGSRGLGLMRIKESLEADKLITNIKESNFQLTVSIPKWWPKQN